LLTTYIVAELPDLLYACGTHKNYEYCPPKIKVQTTIDLGHQIWPYISQGSGHESYCRNENLMDE